MARVRGQVNAVYLSSKYIDLLVGKNKGGVTRCSYGATFSVLKIISCTPESSGELDKAAPCKGLNVNLLYSRRVSEESGCV